MPVYLPNFLVLTPKDGTEIGQFWLNQGMKGKKGLKSKAYQYIIGVSYQ